MWYENAIMSTVIEVSNLYGDSSRKDLKRGRGISLKFVFQRELKPFRQRAKNE